MQNLRGKGGDRKNANYPKNAKMAPNLTESPGKIGKMIHSCFYFQKIWKMSKKMQKKRQKSEVLGKSPQDAQTKAEKNPKMRWKKMGEKVQKWPKMSKICALKIIKNEQKMRKYLVHFLPCCFDYKQLQMALIHPPQYPW